MKKEDILKKGSVEVHAKVSGIRQRHVLKVVREKTAWGMVPYLVGEHKIPAAELIRLAEELQLPIKCAGMTVFPKGKATQDFAEKAEDKKDPKPARKKGLSHDKILERDEEEEEEKNDDEETDEELKEESKEQDIEKSQESGKTKTEEKKATLQEKDETTMKEGFSEVNVDKIEIENNIPSGENEVSQTGQASPEGKENVLKEKKRIFSENVLSEGILR